MKTTTKFRAILSLRNATFLLVTLSFVASFLVVATKSISSFKVFPMLAILILFFYLVVSKRNTETSSNFFLKAFFAVTFISVIITDGINSPFLPVFLSSLILITEAFSFRYAISLLGASLSGILLEFIITDKKAFVMLPPLLSLFGILFVALLFFKKASLRSRRVKSPERIFDGEGRIFIEHLWSVLDVSNKISTAPTEEEMILAYFKNNPFCPPLCEMILVFRPEKSIVKYVYDIENETITSNIIKIAYGFESKTPLPRISDNQIEEHFLTTYNDFIAVYHQKCNFGKAELKLLKLIDSILIEALTTIRFLSYKNIIVNEIFGAEEFIRNLNISKNFDELLELALISLKKMTSAEKTFFIPCLPEQSNSPDFANAIFKGIYNKFPQEAWEEDLKLLCIKASKDLRPMISENDYVKLTAVPVLKKTGCFGLLGCVCNKKVNIERAVLNAEFVAAITGLVLDMVAINNSDLNSLQARLNQDAENLLDAILALEELIYRVSKLQKLVGNKQVFERVLRRLGDLISSLTLKSLLLDKKSLSSEIFVDFTSTLKRICEKLGIEVVANIDDQISLNLDAFKALFLVFLEALSNSLSHAHAKKIQISLSRKDGGLYLKVADDGIGFSIPQVLEKMKQKKSERTGLRKIAETARKTEGKLKLQSLPGKGTVVEFFIYDLKDNK